MTFACPVCFTALTEAEDGLACAVCRDVHPFLPDTRIPFLATGRRRELAETLSTIAGLERDAKAVIDQLAARLARGTGRPRAVERMRVGMSSTRELFARWLEQLGRMWPAGTALPAPAPSQPLLNHDRIYSLLRAPIIDWCHRADTEEMIATKLAAMRRRLAHVASRRLLVVLGAGLARIACELAADFDEVVALDAGLHTGLTFHMLQVAPLVLHEPIPTDVERVDDLYPELRLGAPPAPANLRFVIADALRIPLAPGQASAVLCDYFTDMVPTSRLVRECRRVIAPGGAFMHFGPLRHQVHHDVDDAFTAEELRALLAESGFAARDEEWVEHRFWPSAMMMDRRVRGWSFVAVKLE